MEVAQPTNLMRHVQAKHPEEHKRMSSVAESKNARQTTLTGGIFSKCSPQRSGEITDRIAQFLSLDLRPLSVVEGEGFKRLMAFVEPGYKVPSRTHVTSVCQKIYATLKSELLATPSEVDHLALTTDIWTSRATQAYMTVTCHYLTPDWKLEP